MIILGCGFSIVFLFLLIILYRKWKRINEETRIDDSNDLAIQKRKISKLLFLMSFFVLIPMTPFIAKITNEGALKVITGLGISIAVKIVDYFFKFFKSTTSKILFMITLALIGFLIFYVLILIFEYDLLDNLNNSEYE
jgi:hypothetical protein